MATTIVSPSMIRVTFALVVRPVGPRASAEASVLAAAAEAGVVAVGADRAVDGGATSASPPGFDRVPIAPSARSTTMPMTAKRPYGRREAGGGLGTSGGG